MHGASHPDQQEYRKVDRNFGGGCEKDLMLQLERRGATMRGLHCDAMAQDRASLFEGNLFAPPRVSPTPLVIKYPFTNSADSVFGEEGPRENQNPTDDLAPRILPLFKRSRPI